MEPLLNKSCIFCVVILFLYPAVTAPGRVIYVDDDGPADFNNIQAAIDDANDADVVIVSDGMYTGDGNRDIDFKGKAITLRSASGPENCMIDCKGTETEHHRGFYFHAAEGADSLLKGFTITNGYADGNTGGGIYCSSSSPTISNCIIRGNVAPVIRVPDGIWGGTLIFNNGGAIGCYKSSPTITECYIVGNTATGAGGGISLWGCTNPVIRNSVIAGNIAQHEDYGLGGAIYSDSSSPIISNCTITGNLAGASGGAIYCNHGGGWPIVNSIFWRNTLDEIDSYLSGPIVFYSNIQGSWPGKANIDVDPCFADPGYWDPNGTPEHANDDFWVNGDYHLKSQAGRWDANEGRWTQDDVTSPCIDAGDMGTPTGLEPFPNGGIVNMGAYGGTLQASKSYFGSPVCETVIAGDINGDCKVDFSDFAILASHWLEDNTPVNSNSVVKDGIEYYIQTDKSVYLLAEDVDMLFRVTNLTDADVTIPCSRSGEFNLSVQREGETVWALAHWFKWYSPGVKLSAGDSKDISYVWDMTGDNGNLIEPGVYDVVGIMYNEPWNYENHGDASISEVGVPISITTNMP